MGYSSGLHPSLDAEDDYDIDWSKVSEPITSSEHESLVKEEAFRLLKLGLTISMVRGEIVATKKVK